MAMMPGTWIREIAASKAMIDPFVEDSFVVSQAGKYMKQQGIALARA